MVTAITVGFPSSRFLKLCFKMIVFGSFFMLGLFGMANFSSTPRRGEGFTAISQISLSSVEYDSKFCVIYDYWKAHPSYREGDHITLVLHSTPSYLDLLKKQVETWQGGISIAIFIPTPKHFRSENGSVLMSASQLHLKTIFGVIDSLQSVKNAQKVSMHLFFDKANFQRCPEVQFQKLPFIPTILDLSDFSPPAEVYPINPARNIARFGAHTRLFISGDIEQFFVHNFEPRAFRLGQKVLLEEKQPIVLVHRRFEIDEAAPEPKSKADLRKLIEEKKAVAFHRFVYSLGHNIPGLGEWLETDENPQETTIEKVLNYTNAEWEPQFVGDERVPLHDNRFPFRLRSNTHLGTLLCYHGFKFAIINDLFTYHRGIKRAESDKDMSLKQLSLKQGYRKMVDQFRNELFRKFPLMRDRCPLLLP